MLSEEQVIRVKDYLLSGLPKGSKVVILSETGGRAFGWCGDAYDQDVRAVVWTPTDYLWDTFHMAKDIFDVNVELWRHFRNSVNEYTLWTVFEDLSNPLYVDPAFDYSKFLSFCTAKNVRTHLHSIKTQLKQAEISGDIRTFLHAYRLVLVPLNFLRTGRIVVNVTLLYEKYPQLQSFVKRYKNRVNMNVESLEYETALRDLKGLLGELENELSGRVDERNYEECNRWLDSVERKLNGE